MTEVVVPGEGMLGKGDEEEVRAWENFQYYRRDGEIMRRHDL